MVGLDLCKIKVFSLSLYERRLKLFAKEYDQSSLTTC